MGLELKENEIKVLHHLLLDEKKTYGEIAKETCLTEGSVRRICNRLRQDGIYRETKMPNFAMLGFRVMMLQIIRVRSPKIKDIPSLIRGITDSWDNCVDCSETFDGKIIVRSVWRSPEEFKGARTALHKELGTDWLLQEDIEMVPLDSSRSFIRVKSPFTGESVLNK